MRSSVRIESIPGDCSRRGPSDLPVQVLCRVSPLCIQGEEAKAGGPRRVLNGLHQLSAQAGATGPPMHQQLRNFSPMRLIRCPSGVELDCTNDPIGIASDKEDRLGVGGSYDPSPPILGALEGERREKAHGRSGRDRVHQEPSEGAEVGLTHRGNQSFDHVRWSGLSLAGVTDFRLVV
jgi:hypothetical protein